MATPIQTTEAKLDQWRNLVTSNFSPVKQLVDLVKYPVITEKTFRNYLKYNQYTFDVDLKLTKTDIKKLFEAIFDVEVIKVNTHIPPRHMRRVGYAAGYKPYYKRVIITIGKDQKLGVLKTDKTA